MSPAFLTAEWRNLMMLNYEIDPAVLAPLVPAGVELDTWQGKALVSMVGFMFLKTRVMGLPIPGHRNFEEVNLRFYVRRLVKTEWQRGVVFVKEIVPRVWIARVARWFYGENYVALPMQHTIEPDCGDGCARLVEYTWRMRNVWRWGRKTRLCRLGGMVVGSPRPIEPESEEEFITEHYWGYTRLGKKRTGEYEVVHPRWQVCPVEQPYLLCDIKRMYGSSFEEALRHRPRSAFWAEGSPVAVNMGGRF